VVDVREAMNSATNPHDLKVLLERRGVLQTGQYASSGKGQAVVPPVR